MFFNTKSKDSGQVIQLLLFSFVNQLYSLMVYVLYKYCKTLLEVDEDLLLTRQSCWVTCRVTAISLVVCYCAINLELFSWLCVLPRCYFICWLHYINNTTKGNNVNKITTVLVTCFKYSYFTKSSTRLCFIKAYLERFWLLKVLI